MFPFVTVFRAIGWQGLGGRGTDVGDRSPVCMKSPGRSVTGDR